ncbi:MAG: DUF1048 domain-containing protein [Oscillospiraceae bacterium]|jgi:DNA-binding ferritin-like protein (Dps family)
MAQLLAQLRKWKQEKREYRNYQARKRSLPQEYQIVIKEMEQYFWNFALDSSMMDLLYRLIELFEEGAREQRSVLSITGNDVGGFCDDLIAQVQLNTWAAQRRRKLNQTIAKKLEKELE